jgi:hypothetical protein
MEGDRETPRGRRSPLTDAYTRVLRRRPGADDDPGVPLAAADRRKLLQGSYLWPITCIGVFVPLLIYVHYRRHDELSLHARHGAVLAAFYTVVAVVLGAFNGLVGRLASDWVDVALVCGGILLVTAAVLTLLGLRWYRLALADEPVEIPWVTSLAERI